MKRRTLLAAIGLLAFFSANGNIQPADTRKLVLVTAETSNVPALSPEQVRRLYLGAAVNGDSRTVVPLRNNSDSLLREVFLQKVVYLSEPMYERTLMTRLLAGKGARPQVYDNPNELIAALRATPNAVTYLWADTAAATQGIRIVAELWVEGK